MLQSGMLLLVLGCGAVGLTGCGAVGLAGRGAPLVGHEFRGEAILSLTPAYQTQAIAHRWVASDVYHYEVTLRVWDGTTFVDLVPAVTVVLPQTGTAKSEARFSNLRQGRSYRASVVARGNAGGTAPQAVLNAQTPCMVDFDFRAAQDIENVLLRSVTVKLDPVPYSGNLTISPQNVPSNAASFDLELQDQSTGVTLFSASYPRSQTMTLNRIRTGVRYLIVLSAKRANGSVSRTTQSPYYVDPRGQDLEQDQTVSLVF